MGRSHESWTKTCFQKVLEDSENLLYTQKCMLRPDIDIGIIFTLHYLENIEKIFVLEMMHSHRLRYGAHQNQVNENQRFFNYQGHCK